jgi:TPP-dependent trihydroxycyclohexane-1,2-dione (THcHDO) dehydratase
MWRTSDSKGYEVEYGYSCMGYEIGGGLGVKMAAPDREVIVMVGDRSYLMVTQELVTATQEGIKLVVMILQNYGFASVGVLSEPLAHHTQAPTVAIVSAAAVSTATSCRSTWAQMLPVAELGSCAPTLRTRSGIA